jgi:hypothetical protein
VKQLPDVLREEKRHHEADHMSAGSYDKGDAPSAPTEKVHAESVEAKSATSVRIPVKVIGHSGRFR